MNRELKFRVWNFSKNEMYYGEEEYCFIDLNGVLCESEARIYEQKHAIMQSIGLKDKNQKDVFDGDICRSRYYPNEKDLLVVSWDEKILTYKMTVYSDGIWCEDVFFIASDSGKYEVIGNIYENPNLIGQ